MRLFKGATCAPTLEGISAPERDGVRLAKCLPAEGEGPTCRGGAVVRFLLVVPPQEQKQPQPAFVTLRIFNLLNPKKGARKWSYAMSDGVRSTPR